jgi:hypothetical protein
LLVVVVVLVLVSTVNDGEKGIAMVPKTSLAAFAVHYGGRQLQRHDNPSTSRERY